MAELHFASGFFDRAAVLDRIEAKKLKAMSRFGAFVRRSAKSSLRYSDKVSKPGDPPKVHKNILFNLERKDKKSGLMKKTPLSPLRELIFFAYDRSRGSVVVGPIVFPGTKVKGIPRILEFGSMTRMSQAFVRQKYRDLFPDASRSRRYPEIPYRMKARPFMRPALTKNLPKFAGYFRGDYGEV